MLESKPEAWVEVIDPVTGHKVDVRVSFHSNWHDAEGEGVREDVAQHVNRIAADVMRCLEFGGRFDISDIGDAE